MRRPPPLPPVSRATPAASAVPAGATAAADAPAGAKGSAEHEPYSGSASTATATATAEEDPQVAPVIPLGTPTGAQRPAGLATALGAEAADEPSDDEEHSRVGIRAVWRAARARRRALRAEVRRFTVRQRRRRAVWLGVAASIVVLVLATLGAAYSPLFAVQTIRVVGASQLDAATVEHALDSQLGKPLPIVDESAVKAALVAFPLVESYSLEARPPHELVVRIVERTPVGLIKTAAGYTLVDAAGVVLSTTPTAAPGIPVFTIKGGSGSPAFEAAGQVMRSLPAALRKQVTAVAASTPDDVTLTLGGTNTKVVWGSAEDSAFKAFVLQTTMRARPPADVSVYDVSSPRAIVVS